VAYYIFLIKTKFKLYTAAQLKVRFWVFRNNKFFSFTGRHQPDDKYFFLKIFLGMLESMSGCAIQKIGTQLLWTYGSRYFWDLVRFVEYC
jgi:hypothetical protein